MVILSLPHAGAFQDRRWQNDNARDDLRRMAERLNAWGWNTDEQQLEHDLRSAGARYLSVQQKLVGPFELYASLTGSRQDWSMFASPQRHPAELHVDVEQAGAWLALYRPQDDAFAWNRQQLEHNRFRKFLGRFARGFQISHYNQTAHWVAAAVAHDHPKATRVRVRLYRYATLTPTEVRAGLHPIGHYEHERIVLAEAVR